MASISISDLYRGEGLGEKHDGILNAVFHEIFTKDIPEGCSEQTWIELLTVKHTFLLAERMQTEGDVVSELSEAASPFCVSDKEAAPCILGHTDASFTLDTYTHVTNDMQQSAAKIVGSFMEEVLP